MGEPAHDEFVFAEQLLAVDAEILAFFVRSARYGQAPSYQRGDILFPTMLNRQGGQIHVVALPHDFLARRFFHHVRRHAPNVFQQRQLGKCVFDALGRLGFFQIRQRLPDFAQLGDAVHAHAHRHALGRAEQVGEHGKIVAAAVGAHGVFKQERRPFGAQHAVGDFGHFQMRRNGHGDAFQAAFGFEHLDKFAQVAVFHHRFPCGLMGFQAA